MANTPPVPRLRPEVLSQILQQMVPMPRMRPEPDQLGTGNTDVMPRPRPSLGSIDFGPLSGILGGQSDGAAPQQNLVGALNDFARHQFARFLSPQARALAEGAIGSSYRPDALRRMRTVDRNVRFPQQAGQGGGQEGAGRPAGARPPAPLPFPRVAGRFDGGPNFKPGSLQELAARLGPATPQSSMPPGPMTAGKPFRPESQRAMIAGLLGFDPSQGNVSGPPPVNEPTSPGILANDDPRARSYLAGKNAMGPNFDEFFAPENAIPGMDEAAAKERLKMALWQMMLNARTQPQPKPWVRSDEAASASPQGGFTTPSGMYR